MLAIINKLKLIQLVTEKHFANPNLTDLLSFSLITVFNSLTLHLGSLHKCSRKTFCFIAVTSLGFDIKVMLAAS